MGSLNDVIGNLTILDLSLPGTHDSLTYDLSTTISDGGIDDYPELSKVRERWIHRYHHHHR